MPELRHLRVFLAVADERNFTRAAQRLHLAQQAVSKSVAQLEAELGVALLERTSRDVRLTAAGEALQRDAAEVLARADAAFARATSHGRGLTGRLSVGLTGAVGAGTIRAAVAGLREEAPGLSVALIDVRPGDVAEALRSRRIDVALVRSGPRAAGLEAREVAPTSAVLAVPAGHRLAGRDEATLADADGERLLVWSAPGTPYTDLLLRLCAEAGARVSPVESAVTGAFGGLLELAADEAVAIVPAGYVPGPDVTLVPLAGVTLPLWAVRLPGPSPPAIQRLLDALS